MANRGGARAGAGRPRGNKHTLRFWVTVEEEQALRLYLDNYRTDNRSAETKANELIEKAKYTRMEILREATKPKKQNITTNITIEETVILQRDAAAWGKWFTSNIDKLIIKSKSEGARFLCKHLSEVLNIIEEDENDTLALMKLDSISRAAFKVMDIRRNYGVGKEQLEKLLDQYGYEQYYDFTEGLYVWTNK